MDERGPDSDWPTARAWLAGAEAAGGFATLAVLGAPLAQGAITPGRFDLAPRALRDVLARFSTYDFGLRHDLRDLAVHDYGDLALQALAPEAAFEPLAGAVRNAVAQAEAVVVLGGHNAITWPGAQAVAHDVTRCALLTLDAHLDLRTLEGGVVNGNPVRALLQDGFPGENIVQVGLQSFANSGPYAAFAAQAGIEVIPVERVHERGIEEIVRHALDSLAPRADAIYVDLDLDSLDRAHAPATAGARPGGLLPWQLRRAAELCGRHPSVVALDIVELDPTRDIGEVTVMAGAACLLAFASGLLARLERLARGPSG